MKTIDNEFGVDKKKYKRDEVIGLLRSLTDKFNERLSELKATVSELKSENDKLKVELGVFKDKNSIIEASIKDAQEKASDTEERARLRYSLVMESLKRFSEKWNGYFEYLKTKYPLYPIIKKSAELKNKINAIMNDEDAEKSVSVINDALSEIIEEKNQPFNPKEIINDYVAATGDNGFDLDEVLNPGELQLEDLCKELGLLE